MQLQSNYNPDVLTCLANLSNDEVFTPPTVVNQMLDMLPAELFRSSKTKFLDPVSKSGVFLREIAKRLMIGLEDEIPDVRERANHIFTKQLYGMAITELTSLISRRSVYCSKAANGKYSLCSEFDNEQGNIRYRNIEHTFDGGKCMYCGAAISVFGKKVRKDLESHAYEFIHTDKPEKIFKNMKFDVIIGNPPYQVEDGGAQKSASPIYHKFIQQAKKLNPRYLTMIVPARWYNGGKGLDEFRDDMLHDRSIKIIHDYPDTSECFPGVNIRGGVCYFLWEKEYKGDTTVINHITGENVSVMARPLLERGAEIFIRYNKAIDILRKVKKFNEKSFKEIVSSRKPFGLATNFKAFTQEMKNKDDMYLYRFGENGYISRNAIEKNQNWVNENKVIVPYASPGDDSYPHLILSQPIVAGVGTCCTETYLVIGPFSSKQKCENVKAYMKTRFCRFMILLSKSAQHVTSKVYQFVPLQDFSHPWTDAMLYEKYGLTEDEIAFIESMIRPME